LAWQAPGKTETPEGTFWQSHAHASYVFLSVPQTCWPAPPALWQSVTQSPEEPPDDEEDEAEGEDDEDEHATTSEQSVTAKCFRMMPPV
jgi:hypothetical protein